MNTAIENTGPSVLDEGVNLFPLSYLRMRVCWPKSGDLYIHLPQPFYLAQDGKRQSEISVTRVILLM